ncbi:hypothetical protein BJY59DRAFT_315434 [Rhodotorula toruloides]
MHVQQTIPAATATTTTYAKPSSCAVNTVWVRPQSSRGCATCRSPSSSSVGCQLPCALPAESRPVCADGAHQGQQNYSLATSRSSSTAGQPARSRTRRFRLGRPCVDFICKDYMHLGGIS